MTDLAEPGAPTPERRRRSPFALTPAVATEAGPAQAGQRVYRAVSTLDRLVRSGTIEPRQAEAGKRLRDDYELGLFGAREPTAGSSATTGWYYAEARLDALRRCRTALAILGPMELYVTPVAVYDHTISALAKFHHCNRQEASGILKLGLTTLADHYRIDERNRRA